MWHQVEMSHLPCPSKGTLPAFGGHGQGSKPRLSTGQESRTWQGYSIGCLQGHPDGTPTLAAITWAPLSLGSEKSICPFVQAPEKGGEESNTCSPKTRPWRPQSTEPGGWELELPPCDIVNMLGTAVTTWGQPKSWLLGSRSDCHPPSYGVQPPNTTAAPSQRKVESGTCHTPPCRAGSVSPVYR